MGNFKMNGFCRRLRGSFVATILVSMLGLYCTDKTSVARAQNPIITENARQGATDWRITNATTPDGPNTRAEVEGFASTTSVIAGQSFSLYVNVNGLPLPTSVEWKAFRLGCYPDQQGNCRGGRLVKQGTVSVSSAQPPCIVEGKTRTTGLIQCPWRDAIPMPTDSDMVTGGNWLTGQYLIKLRRVADDYQSYVPIVVRELEGPQDPRAPLLFQASVTTWQAYNTWGGASLYRNDPARTDGFPGPHANRVSFDRPYNNDQFATGEPLWWEVYMLRWLEKRGYNLAYVTNVDIDANPALLQAPGRLMFLSVGHDEYWSKPERDAVDSARAFGYSLGFFSANTAYWRIRLDDSVGTPGVPQRIVTCYKCGPGHPENCAQGEVPDPTPNPALVTVKWRESDNPNQPAQPENALLGVMFEIGAESSIDGFVTKVAAPPDPGPLRDLYNAIYAGWDATGDTLPHLVGVEWDHIFTDPDKPSPPGLVQLATASGVGGAGTQVPMAMTIYSTAGGGIVFAAGTIQWAWGLTNPDATKLPRDYADTRIQRMTENVLNRAGLGLPPINGRYTDVIQALPPTDATATNVSLVAGSGVAGYLNSAAATAKFNSPAGVAAATDGTLFVTEARNHRIRKIDTDTLRTVSKLAGGGNSDGEDLDLINGLTYGGYRNDTTGQNHNARFNLPTGIVWVQGSPNNTLYVSDTGNHCIRKIDLTSDSVTPVDTYAGEEKSVECGCKFGDDTITPNPDRLSAHFQSPRGLAWRSEGLYVADTGNGKIRFIRNADNKVTTLVANLSEPTAVAFDAAGHMYTLESGSPSTTFQVKKFPRLTADPPTFGPAQTLAGTGFGDRPGDGTQALLRPADGLILFSNGTTLVFSDMANFRVRSVDLGGSTPNFVRTLVGNGRFGTGLGTGVQTQVVLPRGITPCIGGTVCPTTKFVVADSGNHRILLVQPQP